MKLPMVVLAAALAGGLSLSAQSPAVPPASPEAHELTDAFPPGNTRPDQFALTANGQRTYFVNNAGECWLYDRERKATTRVASGPLWDLNLSPSGNALAYAKAGEQRGDQYVWVLALNPATGLPPGEERRLSARHGDAPSLSPDGKLVAFARDDATGVGQSVVVVPLIGGTERVVVPAIPSSLANIRWTPDGKTLYFGVNPPVACVPEWSCLPLAAELRQPLGTIRRVAVSGGDVTTVTTARGLTPGLSPDGTTLMYQDTGTARRWVVANADGTPRQTVTLPSTQTPTAWLRGSTAVIAASGSARSLRTMSLAGGQSQVLINGADALMDPSWSPDGTRMAVVARGTPRAELRILNADGVLQRALPLPETYAVATTWSPDQRWIAYTGSPTSPPAHVAMVEVATGRTQPLFDLANDESVSLRWLADSHALVLSETFGRQETNRRLVFRTVDLAGKTTMLREFPLGPAPSGGLAIDDTTAIVMQNVQTGYRIVPLNGNGAARDVLPAGPTDSGPGLSPDGLWWAVRRVSTPESGVPATEVELVRVDGSDHRTMLIPFAAVNNPRIVPGANDLVVFEARRQDVDPGVYLVSAGAQPARKLFTYASQYGPPELSISPDGRRLLYLVWENIPPSLLTMDLAAARVR